MLFSILFCDTSGSVGPVVTPGSFICSYDSHCIFFLPDIPNNDLFFVYSYLLFCYYLILLVICLLFYLQGGGSRVAVSTAAFHARVQDSVPGLGGLKETKMFLPHPRVKVSIVESLRDR